MTAASATGHRAPPLRQLLISLGLLWLAGAALRMTVLAVPPLLPLIHGDLDLSETAIGTLAGLPSLLFAAAAVPGSLLIARFGARPALIAGLLVTALASAARGAAGQVATLFAATIVMGGGIAVMQPALPPIVRAWLPDRIGFATAVYTNGLLIGEIVAVSLTLPVVLPLAGGSWRGTIAFWGLPVLLTALLVALLGPRPTAAQTAEASRRRRRKRQWKNRKWRTRCPSRHPVSRKRRSAGMLRPPGQRRPHRVPRRRHLRRLMTRCRKIPCASRMSPRLSRRSCAKRSSRTSWRRPATKTGLHRGLFPDG